MTTFIKQTGTDNPFDGINLAYASAPTLADLDRDGDLDAVVGEGYGTLYYYENTGSSDSPSYVQRTGSDNPFNGIDLVNRSTPTLADLDGDGDLDAVVGELNGNLNYFENTGSSDSPSYVQRTGSDKPFNINMAFYSGPTLADLDGDGNFDLVVGADNGNLNYYENTGSSDSPSYVRRTGSDNPFNGINVRGLSKPTLADLDGDGDLDAVVGETYDTLNYYENTGSSDSPSYVQRTGSDNPFNGINVGFYNAPTFADIDGDGDLDAVVGNFGGTLYYLENTTNNAPDAVDDTFTTNEDTATTGDVLENDTDADSDPLSVSAVNGVEANVGSQIPLDSGALLTLNTDGTFDYDPNGQFESLNDGDTNTDSFTYTITDTNGDTDQATVTVTIDGITDIVNTNPEAIDDEAITNAETAIDINVLENDTDADGDNLSIDSFDSTSSLGATITDNGDGTLSYDPNGQINLAIGETVTDSFTYTISDGTDTDTATVNLTIFDPSVIIIEGDNEPALEIGGRTEETLLVLGNENEADLGNGDDTTAVTGDGNVIDAGLGDDETTVEGNNNTVNTNTGSDIIEVTGESNTIETGSGTDDIDITGDNNTVEAGSGNDQIDITGDGTVVDAGSGNDDITVTGDASTVDAGSGNDVIVVVGDDNDIDGGRGDDDITGTGQNLIVDGGDGNDVIIINTDNGTLGAQVTGGNGFDMITGSLANDILLGNSDDDVIDGRDGDDIIEGNQGTDNLTGGAGSDIFRFGTDAADGLTNLIVDFEQGVDVLAIEDLNLNEFGTADGGQTYDFSVGRNTLTVAFSNPVTLSATDFTDYQNTFV